MLRPLDAAGRATSTRRRSRSTCAASATPTRSTPRARTTAPERRSTSCTTRPISGAPSTCPLLVLWGAKGHLVPRFDVLGVWGERFPDVRGGALSCGHFLAEELPDETLAELLAFLGE